MALFTNQYYKKFLDYDTFYEKYKGKNLTKNTVAEEVNNNCLNKNFYYILAFQNWIQKDKTVTIYQEQTATTDSKGKKNIPFKADTEKYSFEKFPLYPYEENWELLPIIDVRPFFQMISLGKPNEDLDKIYKTIADALPKGTNISSRLEMYIDKHWSKMGEASNGLYVDIFYAMGIPHSTYCENKKSGNHPLKTMKGKSYSDFNADNLINKLITDITTNLPIDVKEKPILFENFSDVQFVERSQLINDTASRCILLIQSILFYIQNLYNVFDTSDESLNITGLIQQPSAGSLSIEQSLAMAKPAIVPAFKKAYVFRESNLKPFISIKMIFYAENNKFVTIDNFSIPYNNIISMEHNIKEHSMTVNMIDTEGVIGELLIQKMYVISQKRGNFRKIESNGAEANSERPYFFIVEYGWSGPESEDEDELLEEDIFVKCSNRGFIKSISSQFSLKANEYTLTIVPNDQENVNKYMNNHDMTYFPVGDGEELSIVTGLMALFLVLYKPSKELFTLLTKSDRKSDDQSNLENLFLTIEDAEIKRNGKVYHMQTKDDECLNENVNSLSYNQNSNIDELITAMFGGNEGTKVKLKDIKYNNEKNRFDRLKKACETATFCLNGWLVGVYVIWKMKRFFYYSRKQPFIIFDTTGLFDVFDDKNSLSDKKLNEVLKKFNPFVLDKADFKQKIFNEKDNFNNLMQKISSAISDNGNNYNAYELKNIVDIEPTSKEEAATQVKPLTMFTGQIMSIFSSINSIGIEIAEDKDNIFHGADGVFSDFNTLDLSINDISVIKQEYKRRIFSDRNNIYYDKVKDENNDPNKRHENSFEKFGEMLESAKKITNNHSTELNNLKTQREAERQRNKEAQASGNRDAQNDSYAKFHEKQKEIKKYADVATKINILYLSYKTNPNKIAFLNCSLPRKINLLGKQMVQSYSFTPRMNASRSKNKQFFSQGNSLISNEGSGDIIEFSIDPVDIGNFNSLMLSNKNKNNIGFNSLASNKFVGNIYDNAAKYYRTYRDIDGNVTVNGLAQDIARLDMNYQSQTNLKGSITIPGEPYWSNINLMFSKCIFIHVYYANGQRSSHSGLYYVSNAVQSITEGKFTTKLEIIRAPTFLSSLEKLSNKNTYMG